MTALLTPVTLELPRTATYARREAEFASAVEASEFDLTITLAKSLRPGAVEEKDEYGVQEEPAYPGWRTFLLLNRDDPTQPDVYRVVVGPKPSCSCKAGLCKLGCKHLHAITAGIAAGVV